jgi:hypothetical protein
MILQSTRPILDPLAELPEHEQDRIFLEELGRLRNEGF